MHEILRDLENFGKMLELLKNAKVKAMETPHIKLVFDTDFEEIEEMPKAIGFSHDEDEDEEFEEEEAVRKIGFDIPAEPRTLMTRLNLKEMK